MQQNRIIESLTTAKQLLGVDFKNRELNLEILFSPYAFSGAYICVDKSLYSGMIFHQSYLRNSFQADKSPVIALERKNPEHTAVYDVYSSEVDQIIQDAQENTKANKWLEKRKRQTGVATAARLFICRRAE